MPKYVCTVCGYTYDESNGIPEANIPPGTAWVDLPKDWSCPLCGASKTEFTKQDDSTSPAVEMPMSVVEQSADMKEMSPLQISTLCLNLARGCEKQYKQEEATLFTELASYFNKLAAPAKDPNFDKLINLIEKDLTEGLPNANAVASDATDRGALRALVWCEKVTRILKSLLTRYQKLGDALLENTGVYVCTICGFIYIGDNLPSVCPVCKVPNWKFEKI